MSEHELLIKIGYFFVGLLAGIPVGGLLQMWANARRKKRADH